MKVVYTLILAFITSVTFGQRIEVTKGPVLDSKQVRNDLDLPKITFGGFSHSSTFFFDPSRRKTYSGFGFKEKAFHFAEFENYLNYTGVKKLSAENINERVMLNAFVVIDGRIYVFYSMKFPDQDSFSLYVNEVSADMVILGSPIVLHTYKNLDDYGMNISVISSHDKKRILISRLFNTRPKEKQKFECKVIDASFSEVWFKTVEMQGIDKNISIRSIDIDNAGNLFCLVEYSEKNINHPVVYSYFWKSQHLKVFNGGLSEGENFGSRLVLLSGEKPFMVGLNENSKKLTYFIHRIDVPTETLISLGSGLMPPDFYKTSSFRVFETKDWSVNDMVALENNTVVASVEAILVDSKYHQHHSYNAYVMAFREDGTQAWARTIQKKQSTMQGLAGHLLVPANDNVLVIYNDNMENINKKPEDTKVEGFVTKDGMTVVQEIDPNGKVKKYPMMKDAEMKSFMVFLNMTTLVEKDLYFASCMRLKSRFSVESRNITFAIK